MLALTLAHNVRPLPPAGAAAPAAWKTQGKVHQFRGPCLKRENNA